MVAYLSSFLSLILFTYLSKSYQPVPGDYFVQSQGNENKLENVDRADYLQLSGKKYEEWHVSLGSLLLNYT